jgi:hypothetical protein
MPVLPNSFKHYPTGHYTLDFLEGTIRSMFAIMDRYLAGYNRPDEADRPYFYNERATLSILAGGVWQSSSENLVLEEYRDDKACPSGMYSGRYDIWFRAEGRSCTAEAKQEGNHCWPHTHEIDARLAMKVVKALRAETDKAFANVEKDIARGLVHHAFGILFIVPDVPWEYRRLARKSITEYLEMMDKVLERFTSEGEYNVLWGHYFREDLLGENHFYYSDPDNYPDYRVARPGVDVLVCERRSDG